MSLKKMESRCTWQRCVVDLCLFDSFLYFLCFDFSKAYYCMQDFGFCWGVERSIALAYEAVEHYPDRKLHITNELIHNPDVNDSLTKRNVKLIEKLGEGKKDFSTIEEGDVVILPAFGASYEEMEFLNKKVSIVSHSTHTQKNKVKSLTCIFTFQPRFYL